jgi:CheY-like chemotaxis protein
MPESHVAQTEISILGRLSAGVKEAAARTMTAGLAVHANGSRILVVDDTPAVLDVVRKVLEGEGYRVTTCLESVDAVRLAQAERPDLIMLDVVMPEMSGWEVLAALRADAAFAKTPVIVCTAYVNEALGRLAELKGPDQHLGLLPKPFEIEELVEVVASVTAATLSS